MFGDRFARHVEARYRKRGLGRAQARIVDFLVGHDIEGATVLEIGGGVGELQIELLRRGAARATNLELVDAYDGPARQLADEAGVADRIERRILDIATAPQQVERADVVVLHRVVCCYPDVERLLGAAADHAGRLLVFSHPPRNLASRTVLGAQNIAFRLTGRTFRTFSHPPARMLAVLAECGLTPVYAHHGPVWQIVGLQRTPA
ncbi:bifunctional 2-polyprenyl-6-hydroxyphenol methylase/3-demethylubiquinol 3-O-methyltransferase UbiG [Nostocoides sp. HKS02]|uniref:class I SAM-dependent methyltransferase n=1 Tax=Nostocoides sp. HKS02 TaxID=1813880 RepID=UPI001E5E9C25|nr:methyltransferase domain-containing protein [Tetrasphaera sp. HKS02]